MAQEQTPKRTKQDAFMEPGPTPTSRGGDVTKLLIMANGGLVGVPAAYAASHSVLVTAIAALVAVVFVIVLAGRRR